MGFLMCGFYNVWVCVSLGFVMCGRVGVCGFGNVWVSKYMGVFMCAFCNMLRL